MTASRVSGANRSMERLAGEESQDRKFKTYALGHVTRRLHQRSLALTGRRRDRGLLSEGEGRQYHRKSSGNMHDDFHGGNEVLCNPGVKNRSPARRVSDRSDEGV